MPSAACMSVKVLCAMRNKEFVPRCAVHILNVWGLQVPNRASNDLRWLAGRAGGIGDEFTNELVQWTMPAGDDVIWTEQLPWASLPTDEMVGASCLQIDQSRSVSATDAAAFPWSCGGKIAHRRWRRWTTEWQNARWRLTCCP